MGIIQIKELLPSDPLSQLVEKVNFNFDQLVLAGGGPPGVAGSTGVSGGPGPQGKRGSYWLIGPTAGPTALPNGSPLEAGDQFLEADGDVQTYFDILGSTGWTYSGVNIMGPSGSTGLTGGGFEWQYYPGYTGGVQDAQTFGPTTGNSTTAISPNVDFLVPVRADKNALFVGDRVWAYEWLRDFNTYPIGTNQNLVPKVTVVQDEVNYQGVNGLMFGAMGLTSGATLPGIGVTATVTSAYDFVAMGFKREPSATEYHRFRINSFRMPFLLQVGGDDPGYASADLEMSSRELRAGNYDLSRYVNSLQSPVSVAPFVSAGTTQSHIEIVAKPDQFRFYSPTAGATTSGTAGYVALQSAAGSLLGSALGQVDHGFGSVIVGPTFSSSGTYVPFAFAHPSALVISRPVVTVSGNVDSSLKFYSPATLTGGPNDFVGKVVASYASVPGGDGAGPKPRLQLSASRLGINSKFDANTEFMVPRFPLHVSQAYTNLSLSGASGASGPWVGQHWDRSVDRWLAGFDSYNSASDLFGAYQPQNFQGKGIGIGYTPLDNLYFGSRELVLQTYYTGSTGSFDSSSSGAWMPLPRYDKSNPTLALQVGPEETAGNISVGFVAPYQVGGTALALRSKLSVAGSVRVGSTAFFELQHQNSSAKLGPKYGIAVEGSILQGATFYGPTTETPGIGVTAFIGPSYGIFSSDAVIGRRFIGAAVGGSILDPPPTFAVSDVRSGMRGSTYGGEVYIQVGVGNGFLSRTIARHAANGEDNDQFNKPGFQVLAPQSHKPTYLNAQQLADSTVPVAGPTGSGYWSLTTIEVTSSVIKFDGNGWVDTGGSTPSWKQIYENAQGIPPSTNVYMVELDAGAYDGQMVELVFTGWSSSSLSPFLQADIVFRNDARYAYPFLQRNPRMLLQREFNGGGYASGIVGHGFDGPGNQGFPFPFPHGATNAAGLVSSASLDASRWSADGQFTGIGYRSIKLRWMRSIPESSSYQLSKWRWVEVGRTHTSQDLTLTAGIWTGDPGAA